jgi:hypothetical protein
LGGREWAAGLALLAGRAVGDGSTQRYKVGLWSRFAGDLMDLALLGLAARQTRRPKSLAVATAMVLGITALDLIYAQRFQDED